MSLLTTGITNIIVDGMENPEAAAEGAVLSTFEFQKNKDVTKRKPEAHISLYGSEEQLAAAQWQQGITTATAQNWARMLMETPANQMTPTIFAAEVESVLTPLGVQVEARDKSWAEEKKMGSFLSVSRGSAEPPVFLELTYKGKGDDSKPMVLVGKGVTFDTGGISLKPSSSMDDMRADMGGAACVVSTIRALAELKVKVNVKGLVPLCENMPGGKATKPGDVVTAMNGRTICVDNTDAEGRLILADALCYSEKLNPAWVVDIATLTGAMRVALGGCASGAFATDEALWTKLHCAGFNTGDRIWRFPLFKHYLQRMTDYSGYDINNLGQGKGGGSCTAAAFLSEFRPKNVPWIHIDIASVMNECTDQPYMKKGMTGRPTRTLIEFIRCQSEEGSTSNQ